ncbi:MAG: SRPBCC domain-containing protein [Micrococcales bacterium]|nr:SRPBCC domain-containing protein [Micrococcales bacterium]
MSSAVNVDLLLFEGMDLMDFAGPWEVFLTANRLLARQGEAPAFSPVAFSADGIPVGTYGGVQVSPTGAPRTNGILLVPGTVDVATATADGDLVGLVSTSAQGREIVASVCTGAFLLSAAGLLPNAWTTHWEDLAQLGRPGGRRARVVDAGALVTGGGLACGIDVALHLVARSTDSALARLVARQLDYPWDYYGDDTGGSDPVVIEREVAAGPAEVYRLWTTQTGIEQFLGVTAVVDARVGGPYEYQFLADAPEGLRGGEGCRILALEPDRLVAFTWNSPPGFPTRGQHTWVVLTLTPSPGGTHVRLAQWGHGQGPEWDANREYFAAAWSRVLDALAEHCALT